VGGTLVGSLLAGTLDTRWLSLAFAALVYYIAARMLFAFTPKTVRTLPGTTGLTVAGSVLGLISSFGAIAGAAISIPYMVRYNVRMHDAIGTSSAIGFPIAAAATIGYVVVGWHAPVPLHSVGFVYLPAMIGLAAATSITAPIGARVSHRTRVNTLRKVFACLLLILATRTLIASF
jgi:uncharacterized membrane protein YfcA